MNKKALLTRRKFFITCIVLIPVTGITGFYLIRANSGKSTRIDLEFITTIVDTSGMQVVGHEYFKNFPTEGDAGSLVDLIFGRTGALFDSPIEARNYLMEKIKKDFEENRIVKIDGWTLSRTEARFYALVSILMEQRQR